jgi:hypothetical protein
MVLLHTGCHTWISIGATLRGPRPPDGAAPGVWELDCVINAAERRLRFSFSNMR